MLSNKIIETIKVHSPDYVYSCLNLVNYENEFTETFKKLNYSNKNDGLLALFAFYAERRGSKIINLEKIEYYAAKSYEKKIYHRYIENLKDDNEEALRYIRAFCKVMNMLPLIRNSQKYSTESILSATEVLSRASFLYHHGVFMSISFHTPKINERAGIEKYFMIDNWFNMGPLDDVDVRYLGEDYNEREDDPEQEEPEDYNEREEETDHVEMDNSFVFAPIPLAFYNA